jgi:phosphomannomutase
MIAERNEKQNERNRENDKQVKRALRKQRRDVLLQNDGSADRNFSVVSDVSFTSITVGCLFSMKVTQIKYISKK